MSNIKRKLLEVAYDYLYDLGYSIWYSIKELIKGIVQLIAEIKKPYTWSVLLYGAVFLSFYYKNYTLFRWLVPAIFMVYIIKQRVDGRYRHELRLKAFKNNKKLILTPDYNKYTRRCKFKKTAPDGYEEWRRNEMRKNNN